MNLQQLTSLAARIDHKLTQFNLQPDANGMYPWQVAQQQRQKRRVVAATAGAAAIGAGAYGAKRGIDALKGRYGVSSGKDALTVGAADAVNKVGSAAGTMANKLKGQAAQAGQAVQKAAAPVMDAAKRKYTAAGKAVTRGMKSGRGIGSVAQRVGRALIHAEVGSMAPRIVALEAKLDKAIQTL